MPAQSEYSAPAWGVSPYSDLTVPSGGTILVKRLEIMDLVATGLLEEFDTISPLVDDKVIKPAKGKKPSDRPAKKLTKAEQAAKQNAATADLMKNVDAMSSITRILSLMLPVLIQKPAVLSDLEQVDGKWVKIDPEAREDDAIYIDTVPLGDQMFILSWAMEGMDMDKLASFREQPAEAVESVEPGEKPSQPSE